MKPNINLDFYTEGNLDFKRKLAALLILSIQELQQALEDSLTKNDADIFSRSCHKQRTTISILNNSDFLKLTQEINYCLANQDKCKVSKEQHVQFNDFCNLAINDLEEEIKYFRY